MYYNFIIIFFQPEVNMNKYRFEEDHQPLLSRVIISIPIFHNYYEDWRDEYKCSNHDWIGYPRQIQAPRQMGKKHVMLSISKHSISSGKENIPCEFTLGFWKNYVVYTQLTYEAI